MPDDPQIPSVADVVGPGIDALVAVRPTALAFADVGRYGDIFAAWRGQYEVERKRLAEEVAASRLPSAEGDALTSLARSEYDTERGGALHAVGEVVLRRKVVHAVAAAPMAALPTIVDQVSANAALAILQAALIAHVQSQYSATSGTGQHQNPRTLAQANVLFSYTVGSPPGTVPTSFSEVSNAARAWTTSYHTHIADAGDHGDHKDADTLNRVTLQPLTFQGGGATWEAAIAVDPTLGPPVINALTALWTAANAHTALDARAGAVRAGTRVSIAANPTAVPPILGATYTTLQDTVVQTADQTAAPLLQADLLGVASNQPGWVALDAPTQAITIDTLFDSASRTPFAPTSLLAAGGSDGQSDALVRMASKARFSGRFGPTAGALVAGSLGAPGVAHAVLREDVLLGDLLPSGTQRGPGWARLIAADESWAQSGAFLSRLGQELTENWLGFGCRLSVAGYRVQNQIVRVEATINLRDARFLTATTELTSALSKTLKRYFDERPDWWTWNVSALRGVLSHADRRIASCTSVTVRGSDGVPLVAPASTPGLTLTHFAFLDGAVTPTYLAPTF